MSRSYEANDPRSGTAASYSASTATYSPPTPSRRSGYSSGTGGLSYSGTPTGSTGTAASFGGGGGGGFSSGTGGLSYRGSISSGDGGGASTPQAATDYFGPTSSYSVGRPSSIASGGSLVGRIGENEYFASSSGGGGGLTFPVGVPSSVPSGGGVSIAAPSGGGASTAQPSGLGGTALSLGSAASPITYSDLSSFNTYDPNVPGEVTLLDMALGRVPSQPMSVFDLPPVQGPSMPAPGEEGMSIAERYAPTAYERAMGIDPFGLPPLGEMPAPAYTPAPAGIPLSAQPGVGFVPGMTTPPQPRPYQPDALGGMSVPEFNASLPPEAAFLPDDFAPGASPAPEPRPAAPSTRPSMRPPQVPGEMLPFTQPRTPYDQPITPYTTLFDAPIAPGALEGVTPGSVPGAPSVPEVGGLPRSQLPPAPEAMSGAPEPFLEEILPGSPGVRGLSVIPEGLRPSSIPPDLDTSTPVAGDLPLQTDYRSYALPGPAPEAMISPPPVFFGGSLNAVDSAGQPLSASDDRYAASVPGFALADQPRPAAPQAGIASLPLPSGDFSAPPAFLEEILPGSPGVRGLSVIPGGVRPSTATPDLDTFTPREGDLPLETDYGTPRSPSASPVSQSSVSGLGAFPEGASSSAARVPPSFDDALNINAFEAGQFGDVPVEGDLPMRLRADPGPRPAVQTGTLPSIDLTEPTATAQLAAERAAQERVVSEEAQRRIAEMRAARQADPLAQYDFGESSAVLGATDLSQGTGLGGMGLQASSSGSSLAPTAANIAADTAASAIGIPERSFAPMQGAPTSLEGTLLAGAANAVNPLLRGQDTGERGFLRRITGGRPLFGEDGIIPPSDPYTIEQFMADQEEMDQDRGPLGSTAYLPDDYYRVPGVFGDSGFDVGSSEGGSSAVSEMVPVSSGVPESPEYISQPSVVLPSGYGMSLEDYLAMLARLPGGAESGGTGLLTVTPLNLGIGSLT